MRVLFFVFLYLTCLRINCTLYIMCRKIVSFSIKRSFISKYNVICYHYIFTEKNIHILRFTITKDSSFVVCIQWFSKNCFYYFVFFSFYFISIFCQQSSLILPQNSFQANKSAKFSIE